MEDTQNDHQLLLVWSSMQDLASWSEDDDEKGEGAVLNYTAGACWSESTWDFSHQEDIW